MTQGADHITLSIDEEVDEELNHISKSIHDELDCLRPTPSECCIFRVYEKLRTENAKAYEPKIIAIGPYYHGKDKLQGMEQHKLRYLKLLLDRRNENSVDKYIKVLSDKEESARKCYEESSSLGKAEFVRMMLLDGVFIIELFRNGIHLWREGHDPLLQSSKNLGLCSDLLLLENQIPFFILVELFNMTRDPNTEEDISSLALRFLGSVLPDPGNSHLSVIPEKCVKHLLHLVHHSMCLSVADNLKINVQTSQEEFNKSIVIDLVKLLLRSMSFSVAKLKINGKLGEKEFNKFKFIDNITELQEAGIEIKAAKESCSLFDIKFDNGLIEIPPFCIHAHTDSILRNLIAYEQFLPDIDRRYVSDYALFMDCLVNSSKDATYLRRNGIIENCLGDDTMVCNVLNKLNYGVSLGMDFSYAEVFKNVNRHCGSPYNKRMANLRHNYFNSPWAFISCMAAGVLLLLSLAQTIFSAFSAF